MEQILDIVKSKKVDFVEIWFCDILGFLKSQVVTLSELERAAEDGIGVDGSSLQGVMPVKASDMVARLDPVTFTMIPWRKDYKVGRVMADLYHPNG
ncbi:MAG: glutamine synthetase, partial [Planctomycetota bacterium]|nr:glutamine synthetase [Planctomycetota bacterium]